MEIEQAVTQIETAPEEPQVEAEAMEVETDMNMADVETIEATPEPETQPEAQPEPEKQPEKPKKQEPNVPHTSEFVGVHWSNSMKKWQAQRTVKGKTYNGGYYDVEEEAALRSDELVTVHGGESSRARLNFPGAEHINLDEIVPEKLPEPVEKLPQEVVVAAKEPTKKIVKRRKK